MKQLLAFTCAITTALATIPATASDHEGLDIPGEFSANVGLATDYAFRGISQTNESPSVFGGIDWSMAIDDTFGVYLGTWASNIDYASNGVDGGANSEFDFYGGTTIAYDDWSFDVGAIYFAYPGSKDSLNYDFWEIQASATYVMQDVAVTGSVNYSPEYFGDTGHSEYYKLAAATPLPYGLSLNGHIASLNVEKARHYIDWSAGLGYTVEGFDLGLTYYDTDIDNCDLCDGRVIFSVSRSF